MALVVYGQAVPCFPSPGLYTVEAGAAHLPMLTRLPQFSPGKTSCDVCEHFACRALALSSWAKGLTLRLCVLVD